MTEQSNSTDAGSNNDSENHPSDNTLMVPVLPLRDVVVYPNMVIPLFVGREKSIQALEAAMANNKQILLVAQKTAEIDNPTTEDFYTIGTLSTILQLLKLPDGTIKVLVEGAERVAVTEFTDAEVHFTATISRLGDLPAEDEKQIEVLSRSIVGLFEQYVKLNKKVPPEVLTSLSGIDEADRLSDTIAAHMALKLEEKQAVLEIISVQQRLEHLINLI